MGVGYERGEHSSRVQLCSAQRVVLQGAKVGGMLGGS